MPPLPSAERSEVRRVADMGVVMRPHDLSLVDEERPRHHPGIPHHAGLAIPVPVGLQGPPPHPWAEHPPGAAPSQAEGPVQIERRIGDRTGLRPEFLEDRYGILDRSLEDEEHPGKVRGPGSDRAQVSDGLPAEDSAEVPEKDQQGRAGTDRFAQGA